MKIEWRKVLATVAPVLATAAGGPLAGVVTKTLASKLLGKPDATQDEVEQAVASASPDTLIKLKEIDNQFAESMQRIGIDFEKIAAADRASARDREVRLGGDWTVRILAYGIVGSFCALVFSVLFGQVTAESTIAGAVIGYLSAKAEQVVSYYFGSSAGSKQKTEAMSRAM